MRSEAAGPRVRIAPSPTGYFHVGSARSALFNWFVARQSPGGVFILRIEDTDESRDREEWIEGIYSAMAWLGLTIDEGPFRQSDATAAHDAAASLLLDAGYLYYCDCTPASVEARKAPGAPPGYDGFCRDRGLGRGGDTALRYRTPREGVTVVHDLVRGDVEFNNDTIDDFVVVRSSGDVLWALANVTDDRHDRISHVIRGEEHLANAPKQMMLWSALNAADDVVPLPHYAHLPLLVNEQRKKLSKRRDPVATESYRDQGYLAEAFVNYLALLGWSPRGDREIVPLEEMIQEFRLEDVSHSPAFFDVKKLTHMNGEYLRLLDPAAFIALSTPWVAPWSSAWRPSDRAPSWREDEFDPALYARVAPLVQERVATFGEIPAMVEFFFLPSPRLDEAAFAKVIAADANGRLMLEGAIERFEQVSEWDAPALHAAAAELGESLGLPLRKAQAPIRCAVTGTLVGPPLFESLELLGRSATSERLRAALRRLG